MKLNEIKCRNAKPRDQIYTMGDGHGLYLRVYPSGKKSWVLRKNNRIKTVGQYEKDGMTLREARQEAHVAVKVKALKFNRLTVGRLADDFFEKKIKRDYKDPDQVKHYLKIDLASLANKKVVDVTRAELAAILRDKAENGGPVAANRLLSIIKRLFNFARAAGVIGQSEADLLNRDMAGGKENARTRVLDRGKGKKVPEECLEIRQLWWSDLRYRSLLRFLLASGQRVGEARNAHWCDFHEGKWNIPETKTNRPHWVAVSKIMQAELDAQPRGKPDDLVFKAVTRSSVGACLKRWQRREKIEPRWTVHDLRRTFVTRLNGAGVAPHVVEKIVNHKMTGVLAVYNQEDYDDERIAAQKLWSDMLQKIVGEEKTVHQKAVDALLDMTPSKKETRGRPKEAEQYAKMFVMIHAQQRKHNMTLEKTLKHLAAAKTKVNGKVFAEATWRNALIRYRSTVAGQGAALLV